MINKVRSTIQSYELFGQGDKLLIAASGGVDSTVLIHLLKELDYNVSVAHVNYKLRGKESDGDEEFIRSLAEQLKVELFVMVYDTEKVAKERNVSIQMAARDLRYEWFHELRKTKGFKSIVTGHHADDNIETVVFNLTKGTGISGLRGMPIKSEEVVRPLLFIPKEELLDYAAEYNLTWREDSSNQEKKYVRNQIRHDIIPVLKSMNPSFASHFHYTSKRLIGPEKLMEMKVDEVRRQHLHQYEDDRWELSLSWLKEPEIDLVVLHELLQPFDFSFSTIDQVFLQIKGQSGKLFTNSDYRLIVDRDRLMIDSNKKGEDAGVTMIWDDQNEINFDLGTVYMEKTFAIDTDSISSESIAALDYYRLKFPLHLRKWQPGDTFKPLGMQHQKKISDFLVDEKIAIPDKDRQYVLLSEGQICWVLGRRISEDFKITEDTEKVLVLRMQTDV